MKSYDELGLFSKTNEDGSITIQASAYIEDGWYINHTDRGFELYEISAFGGDEEYLGLSDDFESAYAKAKELC